MISCPTCNGSGLFDDEKARMEAAAVRALWRRVYRHSEACERQTLDRRFAERVDRFVRFRADKKIIRA